MSVKKAAIYGRASTTNGNVSDQVLALREAAQRFGWSVVTEIIDGDVSGSKVRNDRLGFDRLIRMIQRREIDVIMVWSFDRLGRSISDLICFMGEVQSGGIDLYFDKQAINTATPSGRMIFGIFAALGEYEREIIRERIHAGLLRAKAEGKRLGRPSVADSPAVITSVKLLREKGLSIHNIAKQLKIGVGTTSKILAA
jgi:DNA invertase Pin-like site-specific DNA recombinase